MTAIEPSGTVDENHCLQLDGPLPISGLKRVRVIILYPQADEWTEDEWLRAAARNPVFSYPHGPAEDIYTLAGGTPFNHATLRGRVSFSSCEVCNSPTAWHD